MIFGRYFGQMMGGMIFIPSLQTSVKASGVPNGEFVMVDIELVGERLVLSNIEVLEYEEKGEDGVLQV